MNIFMSKKHNINTVTFSSPKNMSKRLEIPMTKKPMYIVFFLPKLGWSINFFET